MSTRVLARLFGLLVAGASPVFAEAPPLVLLADTAAVRPGLCDAARIQLAGLAELRCEEAGGGRGELAARIASVSQRVSAQHAALGAFVVEARGAVELVIVGPSGDRALMAFAPLRDLDAPDVDRSLALELADALDAVTRAAQSRARDAAGAPAADAPLGAALTAPRTAAPRSAPRHALWLEAGGAIARGSALPWAGLGALGLRRTGDRGSFELALGAELGSRAATDGAAGALELRGLAVRCGARALFRAGPLELGLHGDLGVVRVRASGVDAEDARGAGSLHFPELGVGPELRVALAAQAYLRLAPRLWIAPLAPRFLLGGETARELGHVGAAAALSLGVRTP